MKKIIIIFFLLFSIQHALFARSYSDLRQSLTEWEETGESKASISRKLDVPYGTLYSFLTREGSTSPTVLKKYESYIKKQKPVKPPSTSRSLLSSKKQEAALKIVTPFLPSTKNLDSKPTLEDLEKSNARGVIQTSKLPVSSQNSFLGAEKKSIKIIETQRPSEPTIRVKQPPNELILIDTPIGLSSMSNSSPTTMKPDVPQKTLALKPTFTLSQETQKSITMPLFSPLLGERKEGSSGSMLVQPKYEDGYDSEEEDDWKYSPKEYPRTNRQHDEAYVPFFRGVHCFNDKFPEEERLRFLNDQQVGEGVFSTAAFDVLQLEYTEPKQSTQMISYQRFPADMTRAIRQKALEMQSKKIRKQVNKFKEGDSVVVDGISFKNPEVGLYYLYVKSYARFLQQLRNRTFLPEALSEFIAVANPIASATEIPDHAIRYAAGLKIAGNVLRPEFDSRGKPSHPYLGKVYVILVPYQDIEEIGLFRVLEAYATNQMPVNCRIINECEAGFAGGISGKYIVSEHVIRVPNFKHEWKKIHEVKYGLTKTIYNNLRKEVLATNGNVLSQEAVYEKLMQQITNRKYRQIPNDRTLSNQLLDIARNEAWVRGANLQFLDFRRLLNAAPPTVAEAKRLREQRN